MGKDGILRSADLLRAAYAAKQAVMLLETAEPYRELVLTAGWWEALLSSCRKVCPPALA